MFNRNSLFVVAGILVLLVGARLLFFPNSDQQTHLLAKDMENPLPPCPNTPNCVRETRVFDAVKEKVFKTALATLGNWNGWFHRAKVQAQDAEKGEIVATFRIGVFTDDFLILMAESNGKTYLHVRSASRVGHGDLGVNSRRVHAFFRDMEQGLASASP